MPASDTVLVWFCYESEDGDIWCEHPTRQDAETCPKGDKAESYYFDESDNPTGMGPAFAKPHYKGGY